MKKNLQCWGLIVAVGLAWQTSARAHAFLDHAYPRVGSTAAISPAEVKIWFTQKVEPAFSSIQVLDAHGAEVDKKDSRLDANDKSLLVVSVAQLPPGTYTVNWHVVSVDTHKTQGRFEFTVK